MKTLKTIFAISILSISCSKDNDNPQPQPEIPKFATVYVGGSEKDTEQLTVNSKNVATIWKDGIAKSLPVSTGCEGEVNAIFIDENTEYAVGYENFNSQPSSNRAVIWKDGVKTTLGEFGSRAYAIYVANGKPYTVGSDNNIAKLWYDNTTIDLPNGIEATGIYVKNNDIFISGNTATGMGYWKKTDSSNFILNDISVPTTNARSISVLDNNVYIAGYSISTAGIRSAKLWNKDLTASQQFGDDTILLSVHAQGQNIHACGFKIFNNTTIKAMVWKNNQPIQLSQNSSNALSVFATATNTYIAGFDIETNTIACVWKDGVIKKLSIKPSIAFSVFVIEK